MALPQNLSYLPPFGDLSYLALVDVELDGVFVDDGVELVHEDVLEVDEHLVDLVELLPPPRHGVQARRVLGQVAQLLRMQDLFEGGCWKYCNNEIFMIFTLFVHFAINRIFYTRHDAVTGTHMAYWLGLLPRLSS